MFNKLAVQLVDRILAGDNPVVPFGLTYDVKEVLDERGYFDRKIVTRKAWGVIQGNYIAKAETVTINRTIRYRVNHGRGYMTQNTWTAGQVVPDMKDIDNKVAA